MIVMDGFADYFPAYSAVPSVLDYTTGIVPVTFADRFLDYDLFQYTPISDKDRVNWRLCEQDPSRFGITSLMTSV